ncbi:hypothetical protein [Streptomyces sp. NPDC003077]|uniref:hypothetical protein n=1 Tax=Streptomyces sp. NPDC003077 TaxID=3154443 RepID=UPI0033A027BC
MIDVVVVLRVEDAVLDFLSVLLDTSGDRDGHLGDNDVHVVIAERAETCVLPAGADAAERLAPLASRVGPIDERAASPGPAVLADLIRRAAAGRPARVWTHSPADNRRSRGRVGRDTALACAPPQDPDAGTSAPFEVWHAVGYSPYLQFVSDLDRPLDRARIAAKLDFVNGACEHLLTAASPEFVVQTPRIPAIERFFAADAEERERLFALLASLDDEAALVADPWEFHDSPYEARRLDATAAWVLRHCPPATGPVVEVGACEGALTSRLAAQGHLVHATEPNAHFRSRLSAALGGAEGVTIGSEDLAELAKESGSRAAGYLLIEMLYYDQDLSLLDALPTDLLFLALEPEALESRVRPWLAGSAVWRVAEEVPLVAPSVETVCGGRAYLSKRGSTGVLLRRAAA